MVHENGTDVQSQFCYLRSRRGLAGWLAGRRTASSSSVSRATAAGLMEEWMDGVTQLLLTLVMKFCSN